MLVSRGDMSAEERGGHGPLVLVVEDDEDIAESITVLLDTEQFRVSVAADGLSALDHACSRRPDVVLLDLMLPRLDGVGFAERLRRVPGMESVPLILCSAGRQLEEAARRIGTPYYLHKPFELDQVLALIHRALADTASRRHARRSPGLGEDAPPEGQGDG
jgi:DNA-binding response OmpR family regulator